MRNVELRTRVCRGYAVVVLRGELDTGDAEDTAAAVAALAAGGQQLIIDLENLDFIDCHAAGALLGVRETARQSGGDVLLAAPHGPALRLLTVLGVPGVHASVAAAAASAGRLDALQTPAAPRVRSFYAPTPLPENPGKTGEIMSGSVWGTAGAVAGTCRIGLPQQTHPGTKSQPAEAQHPVH